MRGINQFMSSLAALLLVGAGSVAALAAPIDTTSGYDVSWPQCGQTLPTDGAFNIVGVNNGLPFSQNPCFQEQLIWAGGEFAQLYINTANPGPKLSNFWPTGQNRPKVCSSGNPDSQECAFNYGFNFAKYAYEFAATTFAQLGLTITPAQSFIWLDVETENSWRASTAKNVSVLKGAIHYLKNVAGVTKLGFYSNNYQWNEITGSTTAFEAYPSWLATASTRSLSVEACLAKYGFTGGRLRLTQYIEPDLGLDVNINCLNAPKLITSFQKVVPATVSKGAFFTLKAKLVSETGKNLASSRVILLYRGDRYVATTNKYGVAKFSLRAPNRTGEVALTLKYKGATYYEAVSYQGSVIVQ